MGTTCVSDRNSKSWLENSGNLNEKTDINSKYEISKNILGRGHFGVVRKAIIKDGSQRAFAIKSIPKNLFDENLRTSHKLHKKLSRFNHPNIVKFYETYEDNTHFYSVMELLDGTGLLDSPKTATCELEVSLIMRQAFLAVEHLHSNGIVHRDLKPENFIKVGQSLNSRVVLVDFGFAKSADLFEQLETRAATPSYIAPEVIEGEYDHRCDYWSLGVMMHQLLVGELPFIGESTPEVLKSIIEDQLDLTGEKWTAISEDAKDLLRKLLEKNPFKRISAKGALKHAWIKKARNPALIQELEAQKRKEKEDSLSNQKMESVSPTASTKTEVVGAEVEKLPLEQVSSNSSERNSTAHSSNSLQ